MSEPVLMPDRSYPAVLVLFVHPYPHRSKVNRVLLEAVRGLDGLVVHDLYEHYPDFHIDIRREQALLRAADLVVFQHPVYWYSAPALLKQWQDEVLEYGFAYGSGGDALHGKALLSLVTTGHDAIDYGPGGSDRYSLVETLRPFEQCAHHCGMQYLSPQAVHGAHRLSPQQISQAAERYRTRLQRLQRGERDE